jgi:tRNA/rRNA methyltransferase
VSSGPAIILVRPQLGQNIGKAARAMLNFGLTELRLVAPRDGWPNPDAGPAAAGADMVLAQAQVFPPSRRQSRLQSGLRIDGTAARPDQARGRAEEMARDMHGSPGRSAILFGPRASGLESDDVALATRIVTVPINPEFGSLNLAQAVIILAYEWSRGAPLAQPTVKDLEPPAPQGELEGLIGQLDADLHAAGYFHPPERTQVTRHMIRSIMSKPRWSSREVKAVRGMIRTIGHPRPR